MDPRFGGVEGGRDEPVVAVPAGRLDTARQSVDRPRDRHRYRRLAGDGDRASEGAAKPGDVLAVRRRGHRRGRVAEQVGAVPPRQRLAARHLEQLGDEVRLDRGHRPAFPIGAFPIGAFPIDAFPIDAFTIAAFPIDAFPTGRCARFEIAVDARLIDPGLQGRGLGHGDDRADEPGADPQLAIRCRSPASTRPVRAAGPRAARTFTAASQPASARSTIVTTPLDPSTSIRSPVLIRRVATEVPTTHGMPYSRDTVAA